MTIVETVKPGTHIEARGEITEATIGDYEFVILKAPSGKTFVLNGESTPLAGIFRRKEGHQ